MLRRNLPADETGGPIAAQGLAHYIRGAAAAMRAQSMDEFVASGDQDRLLDRLAREVK